MESPVSVDVLEHAASSTVRAVGLSIQPEPNAGGTSKLYSDFLTLTDVVLLINSVPSVFFFPNTEVQVPESPIEVVVDGIANGDVLRIDYSAGVEYDPQTVPDPSLANFDMIPALSFDSGSTWFVVREAGTLVGLERGSFDRENDFNGLVVMQIAFVVSGIIPDETFHVRLLAGTSVIVPGRLELEGEGNAPGLIVTHCAPAAAGNLRPVTISPAPNIVAVPWAP